jgi:hypothetical protein
MCNGCMPQPTSGSTTGVPLAPAVQGGDPVDLLHYFHSCVNTELHSLRGFRAWLLRLPAIVNEKRIR